MKLHITYINNAQDILDDNVVREVRNLVEAANVRVRKGSTKKIREKIHRGLLEHGWPNKVKISMNSQISVTSIKDEVGLCLQFGNVARMYADILKLQMLYVDNVIKSAIMIVPSKPVAKALGSNMVNSIRLETELTVFRKVIDVPIALFEII